MTSTQDYRQFVDSLDAEIARISELHAPALSCGPGCASCCLAFSVLPIEAASVREAIGALPSVNRNRLKKNLSEATERCPLLIDELCSIYAARPVICRTQGLPLAYVDEERQSIEVSACPVNFPDDHAFTPEHLLFMDPFNARLAELNRDWCLEQGLPPDRRIPLRKLVCPDSPGA